MANLQGKVALVTGGSRGIGAETARQLAAKGATVAISYNSSKDRAQQVVDSITQNGGTAQAYQANAQDTNAVQQLVKDVVSDHGGLDILVNNAGVFTPGEIAGGEVDIYSQNFDINVRGVYATTAVAAEHLNDNGRIVNIGSFLGTKALPGLSAYNGTKAAIAAFSRTWAKELAAKGITVNTVSPGSIDTEMNPADAEQNPMADFQRTLNAFGRYGKPEEIAAAVVFLASPEASFITGAELAVDGGASA